MSGRMESGSACLLLLTLAGGGEVVLAGGEVLACLFFLPLAGGEVATQVCWSGLREAAATGNMVKEVCITPSMSGLNPSRS